MHAETAVGLEQDHSIAGAQTRHGAAVVGDLAAGDQESHPEDPTPRQVVDIVDRERQLRAQAWEQNPDRDVLLVLSKNRDAAGQRTWIEVTRPDPADPRFTDLWLQPIPEGIPILIGGWQAPKDISN